MSAGVAAFAARRRRVRHAATCRPLGLSRTVTQKKRAHLLSLCCCSSCCTLLKVVSTLHSTVSATHPKQADHKQLSDPQSKGPRPASATFSSPEPEFLLAANVPSCVTKNADADVDFDSDAMRARSQETTLKRRTPRHQPTQETVNLAGPKAKSINELLSQHLSKQIVHVCTPHKALLWNVRHTSCSPRSRLRPRQTVAHGDRHGQPISP